MQAQDGHLFFIVAHFLHSAFIEAHSLHSIFIEAHDLHSLLSLLPQDGHEHPAITPRASINNSFFIFSAFLHWFLFNNAFKISFHGQIVMG
jgi:hypothetical protein